MSWPLVVLAALVAVCTGIIGATIAAPDRAPALLQPAAPPTSAPVQEQQFGDERSAPVVLAITNPTSLTSNADGRITAARAESGQLIESGSSPVDVNTVPVIALFLAVPPYRDLDIGSTGADVSALQDELRRLGYAGTTNGYYGSATVSAVKALKGRAGMPDPDGALPLSQTMWLPTPVAALDTWTAVLGSSVIVGGTLGTVPGRVTSVLVTLPSDLAPGARTLRLWGQTTEIDTEGRSDDVGFLTAVMATRDYAAATQAANLADITGTIWLTNTITALKVPPTALFDINGANACLQSGNTVYSVTIVGSGFGASLVALDDPDSEAPSTVVVGPAITATGC